MHLLLPEQFPPSLFILASSVCKSLQYLISSLTQRVNVATYLGSPVQLCREGNGNPHQYSCLENPMDGGAWWAAARGVAKSRVRLSDFTFTFHFPLFTFMHWRRKWQPTPVFLPGESQGWGIPVPSMGVTQSRTPLK